MRRFVVLALLPLFLAPSRIASADPMVNSHTSVHATQKPIGVLSIPKLKVTSKIYVGVTLFNFDRGVGEWPGSPEFGKQGNIVIGGHRTSGKRPFYNIDQLVPGDLISLTAKGKVSMYSVVKTFVVRPTATWIVNPSADTRLTLFSCHPKGSTSHRYVVQAELVN